LVFPEVAVAGSINLQVSPSVIVEAVAGAAAGSVWVRLPEQEVLFVGDSVVVGQHPYLAGATDTRAWLKTLVELRRARFPVRLIVPGRGPVCGKEDTLPLSDYIQRARRRVRSIHYAGGGRGDLVGLMVEFLSMFPVGDAEQERVQRDVRDGLERVYEELQPAEEEEA
jgi:glyoxylase-like metal-dependent hydrolase (beta-lactamase superfamily II)